MRTVIATIAVLLLLVVLAMTGFIYSGTYYVGADEPHWSTTVWLLNKARDQSIRARAWGIAVPPGLDEPDRIVAGVLHYSNHCAVCHGAPGVGRDDLADGLYPRPPNLAVAARAYTPGELFWIVKHGIKMTGMPSWGDHSDDQLWATVAFIRKLPGMTAEDYGKLVQQVMSHGMQHHPGGSGDKTEMQHHSVGNTPRHEHGDAVNDQDHEHDVVPPGVPKSQ